MLGKLRQELGAALAHRLDQIVAMIGEIEERGRGGEFLALKQHRNPRHQQQISGHRAQAAGAGQRMDAQPGGAVGDLVVVLQKDDTRFGRQVERRRAAPLSSARRNAGPDTESRISRRRRTRAARRGNRCNRPRACRSARPSRCDGNRRSTARRARSRRAPAAAPGWRAAARSRRRQRCSARRAASRTRRTIAAMMLSSEASKICCVASSRRPSRWYSSIQ